MLLLAKVRLCSLPQDAARSSMSWVLLLLKLIKLRHPVKSTVFKTGLAADNKIQWGQSGLDNHDLSSKHLSFIAAASRQKQQVSLLQLVPIEHILTNL